MRVDGAAAAGMAIAPDPREQLLPGEDPVDPLDEKTKQLKFVRRQLEGFLVPVGLPHLAVEHDVAVPHLQRRAGPAVPRPQLPQTGGQLLLADGEEDEVVGADLGGERHHPRHLQAEEDPGGDQLGTLSQPLDGAAPDLQVFPASTMTMSAGVVRASSSIKSKPDTITS